MKNKNTMNFIFEVISDTELGEQLEKRGMKLLSNVRSECCTRVCTRYAQPANENQWGRFLKVNAGVVQY